jgi:hypothetical protein
MSTGKLATRFFFYALAALAASAGACRRPDTAARPLERVSTPVPVSEETDNAPVLKQLVGGFVGTLRIDGDKAMLTAGAIRLVPRAKPRSDLSGCVVIRGLRRGAEAAVTAVPDPRMVVVEHEGLRERTERFVSFSLPLESAIDTLRVQIAPNLPAVDLNVTETFRRHCKEFPRDRLCVGSER